MSGHIELNEASALISGHHRLNRDLVSWWFGAAAYAACSCSRTASKVGVCFLIFVKRDFQLFLENFSGAAELVR